MQCSFSTDSIAQPPGNEGHHATGLGHLEAVGLFGLHLDFRLDRHLRPALLHRAQDTGKIVFAQPWIFIDLYLVFISIYCFKVQNVVYCRMEF